MSATDSLRGTDNGLDALAATAGALLAVVLLLGGFGHLSAVWPGSLEGAPMARLLPGLILIAAAGVNLLACPGLWRGRSGWRWAVLGVNLLLAADLVRLLVVGVPDHPIGVFLALVCSQLIVLGAVLVGLEWRALECRR